MLRCAPSLMLVLIALLGLQFGDCFSRTLSDEQMMHCCGSMPCNPANTSHDCCKTMVSANASKALLGQHPSLPLPATAVADHFSILNVVCVGQIALSKVDAPQHSPPELYTLHSSLLI
jgi:hypothetical protein